MSIRLVPAILASVLALAPARADDLLAIYRRAAETSPALGEARALLMAGDSGRALARAALAPKLGAAAAVSRNRIDLAGFGPEAIDDRYTASSYSAKLTQPLISGQDRAALRAAGDEVGRAHAALLAAQQELIMQVAAAYFAVLGAQADERTAASQHAALRAIRDGAAAARRVGAGEAIAVAESQARFDAAEFDLIAASNAVRIARRDLDRLAHQPAGPLQDLGAFDPAGPDPAGVEAWVEAALAQQPRLEAARMELRARRHQANAAARGAWPTLALDAAYSYADGVFAPMIDRREGLVGLSAAWPIVQGGAVRAAERRAHALADASQCRLEALGDEVRLATERWFLTLEDSVAQVHAAEHALESAATALEATRKGVAIGARSTTELLDGVRQHTAARSARSRARYRHVLARLQLKAAAGVLAEQDVQAVNALLAPPAIGPNANPALAAKQDGQP